MNVSLKWIGGATWVLQIDNIKIACDPVLCPEGYIQDYKYFKTKRLNNPTYDRADFDKVNLWLLTHNHEDHLDNFGLEILSKNSIIISHKSLKNVFKNGSYDDMRFIEWNEVTEIEIDGMLIKVKAVPAIHSKRVLFGSLIGNGNGYLLEIIKNNSQYSLYVTGDSVYNKSIIRNIHLANIDLIIANSGAAMIGNSLLSKIIGRVTNSIDDIITMNIDLKPKKIIPVHWGTFSHYSEILNSDSFAENENVEYLKVGEKKVLS